MKEKIKKVSTCAAATVAKGFFAVTRSKWKSCVFFEALERLEALNFPAPARHHNLAVLSARTSSKTSAAVHVRPVQRVIEAQQ